MSDVYTHTYMYTCIRTYIHTYIQHCHCHCHRHCVKSPVLGGTCLIRYSEPPQTQQTQAQQHNTRKAQTRITANTRPTTFMCPILLFLHLWRPKKTESASCVPGKPCTCLPWRKHFFMPQRKASTWQPVNRFDPPTTPTAQIVLRF